MSEWPQLLPVRWWRDDETRFMSRADYRGALERRRFNLSEVPRGDNPELDADVDRWRDEGQLASPFWSAPIVPMEFERLEPDPIAAVIAQLRYVASYDVPRAKAAKRCAEFPGDCEYKTIGLEECEICGWLNCWHKYLRWEVKYGIGLNAEHYHLVSDEHCGVCGRALGNGFACGPECDP